MAKDEKTGSKAIIAQERSLKALELRKAGATYENIAQMLGYSSKSTAFTAVNRLMQGTKREASKEAFEIEMRRLDDLFMTLWPLARQGELGAIDRCLRIMESRRKMMGLDAPEKIQQQIQQVIRVQYEDVTYQPTEFEPDVEYIEQIDNGDVIAGELTDGRSLDDDDTMEEDTEE